MLSTLNTMVVGATVVVKVEVEVGHEAGATLTVVSMSIVVVDL